MPLPKQLFLFTTIFLLTTLYAFPQETESEAIRIRDQDEPKGNMAAIGLGAEFNFNSRYNFAGGVALGIDVNLSHSLALGVTFTASYNFNKTIVMEPAALFRWYFPRQKAYAGFFVQADGGAFLVFEKGEVIPIYAGGLRVGCRVPLGSFYIEPYGRGGYPYVFGVGLAAGMRF